MQLSQKLAEVYAVNAAIESGVQNGGIKRETKHWAGRSIADEEESSGLGAVALVPELDEAAPCLTAGRCCRPS